MQDGQRFGDSSFEDTMVCVTCVWLQSHIKKIVKKFKKSSFLVYEKMLVIQLPYVKITNQRSFMQFSVLFLCNYFQAKAQKHFFSKNYTEKDFSVVLLVFLYVVFIVDIKL